MMNKSQLQSAQNNYYYYMMKDGKERIAQDHYVRAIITCMHV